MVAKKSSSTSSTADKKGGSKSSLPFSSPLTSAYTSEQKEQGDGEIDRDNNDNLSNEGKSRNKNKKNIIGSKRKEAKRRRIEMEEEEEKRLTSLLFGGNTISDNNPFGGTSAWKDDDDDDDDEEATSDAGALFQIDRSGDQDYNATSDDDIVNEDQNIDEQDIHDGVDVAAADNVNDVDSNDPDDEGEEKIASAWVDDDDDNVAISLRTKSDRIKKLRKTMAEDVLDGKDYESRLRERFQSTSSVIARTDWANVDPNAIQKKKREGDEENEGGEEISSATRLLSSTTSLLASSTSRLQPHILNVIRCPDANQKNYNKSAVQAVQFHPGSDRDEPLMLTAGLDKTLRFFKIGENGENSEKIHGINFPTLPIHSASFLGDTGSVVVSGRRPFFYMYDAEAGKIDKIPGINGRREKSLEKFSASPDGSLIAFIGNDGYIIVIEAKSKMWVADLKMNGSVRALSFTPDGRYLLSSGSDGEVYRWDLRIKKCVDKFHNEDGTYTSFMSASSQFLAVGAESGVVNIYNDRNNSNYYQNNRNSMKRDPVKSIMNLHTSVDHMKFNTDGQILAFSSRREKDSLKLLHVPTQTVFSNWPTTKTPLSYVWSLDFSPGSKYMAIGNDKGKCLLYKLSHYQDDA